MFSRPLGKSVDGPLVTKPAEPKAPLEAPRAVPAQARSRERYERILDAATAIIAEVGYEAATTEAIAERAETSIGSVYRFFPNKLALFQALIPRYLDKIRALFDSLLTPEVLTQPWQYLVERGIDAFADFHLKEPGFRAVVMSVKVTDQLLVEGDLVNQEFARRLELTIGLQMPNLSEAQRHVVAMVVVEIVSALLVIAANRDPQFAPQIVQETKKVVTRYLETYMSPSPSPPPPPLPAAKASKKAGKPGTASRVRR
jgi:AcrR family transcriptional regulator